MKQLLTLSLILMVTHTSLSWACSCNIGDVNKKFEDHVSIFKGKVKEVTFYDSTDMFGDQHIKVTFDIEKQWKGSPDQDTLFTVYNGFSCYGYWFKENQRYLIYAFERDGELNAWICGGVIEDSNDGTGLDEEIQKLNEITENIKSHKQNTESKLAAEYYEKAFGLIDQSKDKEAIDLVEKAAELGHSKAQFLLGYMVDVGTAGYSQSVKAIHWYKKAANQGNMDAQFNLGRISEERRVPEHYINAVKRKIKEEERKSAQVNTVFVGKLLGYEDIPLVQPASCFEPNVLCMNWYETYKIKVMEVLAGESLSGVINASRVQHGQYMYRGSDESLFVVTKIPDEKSMKLLKASHYLREHQAPQTQYCLSEPLDNYIPVLKDFIYSTCTDVSLFRGEIKMDFLEALVDTIVDKLTEDKKLIKYDEGYSINGVFFSNDVDDEDDNCNFGLDYMDYDRLDSDPECEGPKDTFEMVQYVVKKGGASDVEEMITNAIRKSKLELSTIEMKFKTIENEDSSVLEWHYRNPKSIEK